MKKGFTMSEVLITLGVFGVVIAMTLPTVINNAKERETVTKVKKFYSIMSQALLMAISKHGYVDSWNFCEKANAQCVAEFVSYLKPELKIAYDCGDDTECPGMADKYITLDGKDYTNVSYKNASHFYRMTLFDGSHLWIRHSESNTCENSDTGTKNVCGLIWVDVNGAKKPNQFGNDVFAFFILKDRIIPHSGNDCYPGKGGWGCARYILEHDNMKYLRN